MSSSTLIHSIQCIKPPFLLKHYICEVLERVLQRVHPLSIQVQQDARLGPSPWTFVVAVRVALHPGMCQLAAFTCKPP